MAIQHETFLRQAIDLAVDNVRQGLGGPFGALVVTDGEVIATGTNRVTTSNDPTAHAEIVAIRAACQKVGAFRLDGCNIYTSCEPCPMCLGAIYWARVKAFYFAGDKDDAARGQFDDSFIYSELRKPVDGRTIPGYRLLAAEGFRPFEEWLKSQVKVAY
jgi:tRNA(Arg) A34 adenosine deaminase TadA